MEMGNGCNIIPSVLTRVDWDHQKYGNIHILWWSNPQCCYPLNGESSLTVPKRWFSCAKTDKNSRAKKAAGSLCGLLGISKNPKKHRKDFRLVKLQSNITIWTITFFSTGKASKSDYFPMPQLCCQVHWCFRISLYDPICIMNKIG